MMKIHTDTWKGQIFVNLSEQPTETLGQWLGDFGKELNHYDWDRFEVAAKWEREKCLLRDAINEDLSTNEATQVSINNGHIKHLHYSEQETALRHHYYYMEQLTK